MERQGEILGSDEKCLLTLGHLEKLAFGDFSEVPASSLVAIIARLRTSHFQSYLEKQKFFEVPFNAMEEAAVPTCFRKKAYTKPTT